MGANLKVEAEGAMSELGPEGARVLPSAHELRAPSDARNVLGAWRDGASSMCRLCNIADERCAFLSRGKR